MTPEEINIAIGEVLGRTKTTNPYKNDCGWCEGTGLEDHRHSSPRGAFAPCPICLNDVRPDFYNDLNEMHTAEEHILRNGDEVEWEKYEHEIVNVFIKRVGYQGAYLIAHASAPVRAEAFLRYHRKWVQ
jgi:hypothetical protein